MLAFDPSTTVCSYTMKFQFPYKNSKTKNKFLFYKEERVFPATSSRSIYHWELLYLAVIILVQGSLPYTNYSAVAGIETFSSLTEFTQFLRNLFTSKF